MRALILIMSIVALLLVAGCAVEQVQQPTTPAPVEETKYVAPVQPTGQIYQVVMESGQYSPLDLVIKAGDTVEWVNVDYRETSGEAQDDYRGNRDLRNDQNPEVGVRYTVTFENAEFNVDLVPGATAQYTFMQPGQYFYFDQYEPAIRGSVTVE